jgi:hypothetical protein
MSIQEVTEPSEIIVCFTRGGKALHALRVDCKTALSPWITFASGETLDRVLIYLGATYPRGVFANWFGSRGRLAMLMVAHVACPRHPRSMPN